MRGAERARLRFPIKSPMLVAARLEGQNSYVRELSAVLDFNSPWCIIQRQDGIDLGYPEAANLVKQWEYVHPDRVPRFLTMRGIERGIKVTLRKVSVGRLVATDVDALVLEMQPTRLGTFEVILGVTFLKNFRLTVDMKNGYLSLLS